jgi:hypothetical protein
MKKLCFLALLCLVSSLATADGIKYAADSSRTSLFESVSEVDTVKSDNAKLSVRSDYKAKKSYIKFNISDLDIGSLTECNLRITVLAAKSGTCSVSAVNDDYTTNIGWTEANLTWNTAPGNYTSTDGINPDAAITLDELQDNLDPTLTTLIGTIDYTGAADDQFTIDVLSILQADTDGIIQFVLHGSTGSVDFGVHDHVGGDAYHPALVYTEIPGGDCIENVGILHPSYAVQSCRTSLYETLPESNSNVPDNNKLAVRGDNKAKKSWIKFDIASLGIDPGKLRKATLRVTLNEAKPTTCLLSAVNDDCTDNIGWTDADLTWNNAPGNYTSSNGINPDAAITIDDLQDNLDPTKTTSIATIDYLYGGQAGEQFFFNVLPILQADTDGIVQFVLHGSANYTTFATHDHTLGDAYWPLLEILEAPIGADNPYPCPGEEVQDSLSGLSWDNPDPNDGVSDITCTVYLGTEPNRPQMESFVLNANEHAILINTDNFPIFGDLRDKTTYYWVVDCDDPSSPNSLDGLMWDFYVNNNDAPLVDAGPDQTVWLGKSGTPGQEGVALNGTTSDDGLPTAAYTVKWTQVDNGAPTVDIDPNDVDDTSILFTTAGDYEFMLAADDTEAQASNTVRIVVGENACDASHIKLKNDYDAGDFNKDCIVNLEDLATLIAKDWLRCSDEETNCQ